MPNFKISRTFKNHLCRRFGPVLIGNGDLGAGPIANLADLIAASADYLPDGPLRDDHDLALEHRLVRYELLYQHCCHAAVLVRTPHETDAVVLVLFGLFEVDPGAGLYLQLLYVRTITTYT